ncbi:ADM_collapsed_G0027790.mRNA.1.CDS.1 [Saccharomyces cerevisiae]|nr:ADM_collapsed_G0027790.mRNA.1.CDS.1 [Saccharomyces cerevisiae]
MENCRGVCGTRKYSGWGNYAGQDYSIKTPLMAVLLDLLMEEPENDDGHKSGMYLHLFYADCTQ